MSEWYPDDSELVAMMSDVETGVEYIATGKSPYYVEFRRLVDRMLRALKRANDFRPYRDGALSVGVRPGRCLIGGTGVEFAGESGVVVENNATTWLWLNGEGEIEIGQEGLPTDRTTFVPVAEVAASAGAIVEIKDLRGEVFLGVVDAGFLGLSATVEEINQALAGISEGVDAAALNMMTGGTKSSADVCHRHVQVLTDEAGETEFRLINENSAGGANIALKFDLANKLPHVTALYADDGNGWLRERYGTEEYTLVGTSAVQWGYGGSMSASQSGKLMGMVGIDGEVVDVVLSVGGNIVSSDGGDGVTVSVKVNGIAVTSTNPQITSAAGSGFRSTGQSDGTAAVVKGDGTEEVSRGDVLTVDMVRTANGTVSVEAMDVVVMVVMKVNRPG